MYIYIHLPFCSSICNYCDFPKVLYDKKMIKNYLTCLEQEIKNRYKNELVKTIYIGGGTPTCLDTLELKQLLELTKILKKEKEIEFTIESNIESITPEKIKLLIQYGVNRISLGVQSFQDKVLKELNRHHNKKMIINVIKELKRNNFKNISIDYIYGINEDINSVKEDINCFLSLSIPHISCYSLIIEDNTIFKINGKRNIKEEIEEEMYRTIETLLEKNGYHHYEISNYATPGYESIHNINYWNNGEYLGLGLGAVSYINNIRRTNTKNLSKYLKKEYLTNELEEDLNTRISNDFILGLRKIDGISKQEFRKKYQKDILEIKEVKKLLKEGLLEETKETIKIPKKYIYASNEILIHFL